MRIVRDTGNVSLLLPQGIDHIADAPYTLHHAILQGLRWNKIRELPPDEQPPKRIWLDDEKMADWWQEVDAKRREKYGIKKDDDAGVEGVDYAENEISLIAR